MTQYCITQAARIAGNIEGDLADMIGKACKDEPREVRDMVWSMLATRLTFLTGRGDCFVLPPLDEL